MRPVEPARGAGGGRGRPPAGSSVSSRRDRRAPPPRAGCPARATARPAARPSRPGPRTARRRAASRRCPALRPPPARRRRAATRVSGASPADAAWCSAVQPWALACATSAPRSSSSSHGALVARRTPPSRAGRCRSSRPPGPRPGPRRARPPARRRRAPRPPGGRPRNGVVRGPQRRDVLEQVGPAVVAVLGRDDRAGARRGQRRAGALEGGDGAGGAVGGRGEQPVRAPLVVEGIRVVGVLPVPADEVGGCTQLPIENSASRSCCEKTSNATIVLRPPDPRQLREPARDDLGDLLRRCARAASPTKSHSPVTDQASATPSTSASAPPRSLHRAALGLDQDDRVGHRTVWVSPGARIDDLRLRRVLDVGLEGLRRRSRSAGTCRSGSGSPRRRRSTRTRSRRRSGPSCSGRRSGRAPG